MSCIGPRWQSAKVTNYPAAANPQRAATSMYVPLYCQPANPQSAAVHVQTVWDQYANTTYTQVTVIPAAVNQQTANMYYQQAAAQAVAVTQPGLANIPASDITFHRLLGEGAFGQVYLGIWRNIFCAVKVPKATLVQIAKIYFEKEVEQLRKINHPNIVTCFGICLEAFMIVFEYMENGSLENYLRTYSPYATPLPAEILLSIIQLCHIAKQILDGLVYLASQGILHRDLATRNCLVGNNLIVKIADFGMSRDINGIYYYKAKDGIFPIAWMAPESLLSGKFTLESEVWSFGVVLWEIFSYGSTPNFGLSNLQDIKQHIINGNRLAPPNNCPEGVYKIMLGCWNENPQCRLKIETVHALIVCEQTNQLGIIARVINLLKWPFASIWRRLIQ